MGPIIKVPTTHMSTIGPPPPAPPEPVVVVGLPEPPVPAWPSKSICCSSGVSVPAQPDSVTQIERKTILFFMLDDRLKNRREAGVADEILIECAPCDVRVRGLRLRRREDARVEDRGFDVEPEHDAVARAELGVDAGERRVRKHLAEMAARH